MLAFCPARTLFASVTTSGALFAVASIDGASFGIHIVLTPQREQNLPTVGSWSTQPALH
jgi:hypothetical protein